MGDEKNGLSQTDKWQWWGIIANLVLGVCSLVVAFRAMEYTRQQADAAREQNARASGRIPARLVLEASLPDSDTLPPALRRPIFGTEFTTFHCDTPDKLVQLNHRIVLRNVGDEPVEAVRVTVAYDRGFGEADKFRVVGTEGGNAPILTEQVHREEHTLDQKINKNEVVVIPLTRGLLHQMLQGQRGQLPDSDRYGEFVVRCYGRIVGGTSFDGLADEKYLRIRLLWLPKGFPEERVAKTVEGFKPRVEVMKAADAGK